MPVAKMMTKSATYTHLAQKTNLTKKQVAEFFDPGQQGG
jgi:nucleoid DNA-binding protein